MLTFKEDRSIDYTSIEYVLSREQGALSLCGMRRLEMKNLTAEKGEINRSYCKHRKR